MQSLIVCVLIIAFISPCLCHRWNVGTENAFYNVRDYGAVGDGKSDDTQAFLRAWQSTCRAQGTTTLLIPQNYVFLVTSLILNGPCYASSIQIKLQGEIVAPPKDAWVGYKNALISISNVNGLTIDGSGGLIDGYGSTWWSCKNCQRPLVLLFNACNYLTVINLKIINSPRAHIGINGCEGGTFSHINISAPGNSPNTDGFDIGSSKNILIQDSTVETGDDCIAINGGSSYINATRIACGPGHGISIGSLGRYNYDTVEDVYVRNCSFTSTTNGARIKTFPGRSGYAKRITFEAITLTQTQNPIIINQYYDDLSNEAVKVSEVTFRGFQGTSADGRAINLDCDSSLGCFNIVLDQINIVSSTPGQPASCSCNNAHGTVTSTIPNCGCLLP